MLIDPGSGDRRFKAVELLLATGADVHAIDRKSHSTPLHRAVTSSGAPATGGKTDVAVPIVQVLLKLGADSKVKNKLSNAPTDYPMHSR